jgi:toxin-antitoxin system PIN domain toxin
VSASSLLLDANLWVALTFTSHPRHAAATALFAETSPRAPACFCRATEQSFLRLASTPAILEVYGATGLTNADALRVFVAFTALPRVRSLAEPSKLADLWHKLAGIPTTSPKIWMDAYLAAFAIRSDLTFVTLDHGFRSYESAGLRLRLLAT